LANFPVWGLAALKKLAVGTAGGKGKKKCPDWKKESIHLLQGRVKKRRKYEIAMV